MRKDKIAKVVSPDVPATGQGNILDSLQKNTPNHLDRQLDVLEEIMTRAREIMTAKKISQKELADRLKVKEAAVSRLLTGTQNVTIGTIAKLEEALGEKLIAVSSGQAIQGGLLGKATNVLPSKTDIPQNQKVGSGAKPGGALHA